MKTYENRTIRVTLTDEQSARWNDCRATILSHAMVVLGNRSEGKIVATETPTDEEIRTEAIERLRDEFILEHCRYNPCDVLMRLATGRIMSAGMWRDVETAVAHAHEEIERNPLPHLTSAREALQRRIDDEIRYRRSRANSEWNIEIIGIMPSQIGMCRYQEANA